jgi:hypothetical protein
LRAQTGAKVIETAEMDEHNESTTPNYLINAC